MHASSMVGIASDFRMVYAESGEAIARVTVPTFFLHGPDDCFTSPEQLQEYTACNTNVSVRMLPEGGHLVVASHAELFWSEIAALLA